MVQLIRITTNDETGLFNNQFNDDLIIEQNSKVALHSMTCEISTKQITVDAQNNEISFKLSGGTNPQTPYKVCYLTHGNYTASTISTLLTDITVKLNSSISCTNAEVGRQWDIIQKDGKINFNLRVGKYVQPTSTDPAIVPLVGYKNVVPLPGASANYTRGAGTAGTNDAFMWVKSPNCKGSSSFSGRIFQPTNNQGFIIAYLASPPTLNTTAIDTADILYGIEFVSTASLPPNNTTPFYKIIHNGQEYTSLVAPVLGSNTPGDADNDYLSIDTGDGSIQLNIYRGVDIINLLNLPYDHITNLFPVVIFKGDNSSRVNGIKFNSDPVYNVSNDIAFLPVIADEGLTIPNGGTNANTIKALKFGDVDLATILGFTQTELISPSSKGDYYFVAKKDFTLSDLADSFVIELLNIPLNSYDGLTHQRRNILHTVVQTDMIRERLTYIAPFPLYIDMKNANKLSLREVRARILREDLTAVNLNGFSQITILISE